MHSILFYCIYPCQLALVKGYSLTKLNYDNNNINCCINCIRFEEEIFRLKIALSRARASTITTEDSVKIPFPFLSILLEKICSAL